jgi:hypothetical protein
MVKSSKTGNESATEASYRVSYRITLAAEAHTISETLKLNLSCQGKSVSVFTRDTIASFHHKI